MKIKKLLMITSVFALIIALYSFVEKSEGNKSQQQEFQKVTKLIEPDRSTSKAPDDKFTAFICVIEGSSNDYLGIECVVGPYSMCLAAFPCWMVYDRNGRPYPLPSAIANFAEDWGFTEDEVAGWVEGEQWEVTTDLIKDHYEFFEHLSETGKTLHPDEILEGLE